jgi:acyl carrier protein
MTTEATLRRFIIDELSFAGDASLLEDDDYPLLENDVIDSLGVFQLVSFLETEFAIEVDDDELVPDNFGSIRLIAALVERTRAA